MKIFLEKQQEKLRPQIIDYNLEHNWNSHSLINSLRERVAIFLPAGLYDPLGNKKSKTEKEIKLKIESISKIMNDLRKVAIFEECIYLKDTIFGSENIDKKIRKRIIDDGKIQTIEVIYKYKKKSEINENIRIEIEDNIYYGSSDSDANSYIKKEGDFKEENSYEKTRFRFLAKDAEFDLDVYPFGVWLEIEGEEKEINNYAEKLGFKKEDYLKENADELFLNFAKKNNMFEYMDIRFGFDGKR